jgi:hypothetical protein
LRLEVALVVLIMLVSIICGDMCPIIREVLGLSLSFSKMIYAGSAGSDGSPSSVLIRFRPAFQSDGVHHSGEAVHASEMGDR